MISIFFVLYLTNQISDEILVRIDNSRGFTEKEAISSLGLPAVDQVQKVKGAESLYRLKVRSAADFQTIQSYMKGQRQILYVEPNYYFSTADLPNDSKFKYLWAFENRGQKIPTTNSKSSPGADIRIEGLWERGMTSSEVIVAVLDSGVEVTHPDLIDNLFVNPLESGTNSKNGIDDDQNGFIDDVHGWNFFDETNNLRDDLEHGTHVAGTIGARGDNKIGVAGVAWRIKILPIKFINNIGFGTYADAIEGLHYAAKMGAKIINLSFYGSEYSEALDEALRSLNEKKIMVVAAAGNLASSNDRVPQYPASMPLENIISVAATNGRDELASFSNFGSESVHLLAPGVGILSTVPKRAYDYKNGTSMAAPLVAGALALLMSDRPDMSPIELKNLLIKTSAPVMGLRNKSLSRGRIDLQRAIDEIANTDIPQLSEWQRVDQIIESKHPYTPGGKVKQFVVRQPGVRLIRVHFAKIETQKASDSIRVYANDPRRGKVLLEDLSGSISDYTSDFTEGEELVIDFRSNANDSHWPTEDAYGFKIDRVEFQF